VKAEVVRRKGIANHDHIMGEGLSIIVSGVWAKLKGDGV
jgi:hypothetical protein